MLNSLQIIYIFIKYMEIAATNWEHPLVSLDLGNSLLKFGLRLHTSSPLLADQQFLE